MIIIIRKLALTGVQFCDSIVWTNPETHQIMDVVGKLTHFYYTALHVELIDKLCNNM